MAAVAYQVRGLLEPFGADGRLRLDPSRSDALYFRFDLADGLLALLAGQRYGWSSALDEFADAIDADRETPPLAWPGAPAVGLAAVELRSNIDKLLAGFDGRVSPSRVGEVLRDLYIQTCILLAMIELQLQA
ncbi:MAG: hypothetical protein IPK12_18640 [Gemmatimonadetes bacterium]|nr:hypothetical protein [Gemmatimonadota bacterium]